MMPDLNPVRLCEQIDDDTRLEEIARRNALFGLWAGQRMGLQGAELETYAWSVHFSDLQSPGYDDLIEKVAVNFARCGKAVSEPRLRSYLREMVIRASADLALSDHRLGMHCPFLWRLTAPTTQIIKGGLAPACFRPFCDGALSDRMH